MPSLTLDEIKHFSLFTPNIFIETGTNYGDTVNNCIGHFKQIYSIELSPTYASQAKNRFYNNKDVTIIEGDSVSVLNTLSKEIDDTIFFWLDGHWSGGDTARGSLDCPLLEEIKIINNNCKQSCIIAIDDVRLFGTHKNEDWSIVTKEAILEIVKDRFESCKYYPSVIHSEDRMVIHLK